MLIQSFSGIRGICNKDLNEDIARRYAYAYFSVLKKNPKIVIGTDTRHSSDSLKKAIFDVFEDIIDIGIATTPMTELAVREYKADGGIIITASHNEPEWNGFKFLDTDGALLRPKQINKVIANFHKIREIPEVDFMNKLHKKDPEIHRIEKQHEDIKRRYYEFIIKTIKKKNIDLIKKSKFRIVLDPNGGAGVVTSDILNKLGINVITINTKPGVFKRKIEPNKESLIYLKEIINKNNAHLAAGFDCDADRVELLLPDGSIVSGQYLLALIIDDALSELKSPEKETIIVNDATSNIVREVASKYQTKVIETEVGEINVLDAMILNNSKIGGEGSSAGAIIPPSRCRDGVLTLLSILKLIAKRKKSLKDIINDYPVYCTLKDKVKISRELKNIKNNIRQHYLKKGYKVQETGITGGLKIIINNSFLWFRQSKTEEGILRIMADSKSKERAEHLLKEGKNFINA